MYSEKRCAMQVFAGTVLLTAASAAFGQITLDPAVNYAVGVEPSGMTMADFNDDGHIDFATTVDGPDRVVIFFNDGAGGYALGSTFTLPNSSSPQDLIAGDLNNDGTMDIAVAMRDPVGTVMILHNTGSGVFTAGPSATVDERPRGISIGDMNNDGWLDLAVVNRDASTASVITNNAGTLSVQTFSTTGEPRDSAFGDFDGDGWLDLAVSDRDNRVIRIYDNTNGVFSAGTVLPVGGQVRPDGVIAADLTGNGFMDIATATSSQSPVINQVSVFTNNGTGFAGPFNSPTGGLDASDLVAGDLDCDGMLDLAVSNSDSNNVSALANLGSGLFDQPIIVAAGTRPGRIDAADVTGNGGPDLIVANRDSNSASVILNQSKACDGNGGGGDPEPCVGDLNEDGSVNGADLLILLSNWGACPE